MTKDHSSKKPPPSSIGDLVERYCQETVLRPASRAAYTGAASIFQRDTGVAMVADVTHDAVLEWRDAIIGRGASLATWNTYRRQMKTVFNFAAKHGWVEINHFVGVKPLTQSRRKKTVTKRVLSEAIKSLKSDTPPATPGWFWLAMLKLLYYTGMRRRQVAALRWRDIDFDRKIILLSVEGSKSKREWEIPLPRQCCSDLRKLYRASKQKRERIENCQVFWIQLFNPRYKGNETTPDHISSAFLRISQHSGFKISPHRLRHTMATDLAQGINPDFKSIQYLLGHSNLAMTMEYVNPDMDQIRLQLSKLSIDSDESPPGDEC